MLADDAAVLADLDPLGIGADLDRAPDRARRRPSSGCCRSARGRSSRPRPARHGTRRSGRHRAPGWPLRLEHLPDRLVLELGMAMRLGVGDRLVEQPGVQLLVALHPEPRREEALAHEADLVLDLPLLPARGRRAGDRIDQVVAAHLQEAAVVEPAPCRRRSSPPPSSCCRRCRACRRP